MKKPKIVTIIGARPQFVKAAPVSRALKGDFNEILVHTGQHYDFRMSQIFFDQLNIPQPKYNLGVGSGTHGQQTGRLLEDIETVLIKEKPHWVIVYGDTNSTLAGALAASKLHLKIAHIEAGLRSFDRTMPEEVNRVLTDHLSSLLLCPTQTAVRNLAKEGIKKGVFWTGDVMLDSFKEVKNSLRNQSISKFSSSERYALATIHRASNTDSPQNLRSIISSFSKIPMDVLFLAHPRTKKSIKSNHIPISSNIKMMPPAGFKDMVRYETNAEIILTDSGGVQKEAYFAGVPCLTLRDTTEWVETLEKGRNRLLGPNPKNLPTLIKRSVKLNGFSGKAFGDGRAAQKIASILKRSLS